MSRAIREDERKTAHDLLARARAAMQDRAIATTKTAGILITDYSARKAITVSTLLCRQAGMQ